MARKASKSSLTRTQTAAQAYNAIVKKYGEISQASKYMHKGKGNWVKYSIENDRTRTGKVTTDIKKWREAPHKLDFKGKDTAGSGKKVKTSFSVSALKAPTGLKARKGNNRLPVNKYLDVHGKQKFGKFIGRHRDIEYTFHPNTNTISFKWDLQGKYMTIPLQFHKLKDVEVNSRLTTKAEVVDFAKNSIDIIRRGVNNVFYKTNRNLSNDEVARATKTGKHKVKLLARVARSA